ncbi:hypothetical protein GQ457_02G042970 [Hibiscus cannabinus]
MVDQTGCWDWSCLTQLLSTALLLRIACILPPHAALGSNRPRWRWDDTDNFRIALAYLALSGSDLNNGSRIWRHIWRVQVRHRVRVFLWMAMHERLLTNVEICRRHLDVDNQYKEDLTHVLRDCVCAREVWSQLGSCSVLMDELWAAHDALVYAWRLGFCQIDFELDNKTVVHILCGDSDALTGNTIILRIQELLDRDWDICVVHVDRLGNVVADGLAKMVRRHAIGEVFHEKPPPHIVPFLLVDQCPM